jgi:hypothetical protein
MSGFNPRLPDVRSDRKVTQTIPEACSVCKKINYFEIKTENGEYPLRSTMHAFTVYFMFDARFLCHGNGLPEEILTICLAQKNWKMYFQTHSGKLR